MKFWGTLLRIVVFSVIPALLSYIGSDEVLLDALVGDARWLEQLNTALIKQLAVLLSVLLTSGFLVVMYEVKHAQSQKWEKHNHMLYNDLKTAFLLALSNEIGDPHINSVEFRVYKEVGPMKKLAEFLQARWQRRPYRRMFELVRIPGLSDDGPRKLFYLVDGDTVQGLVGRCFQEKEIKYEEDISALSPMYNLTPFQISNTRSTKFCLCVPIFNAGNQIVSILAMECIYSIRIPDYKESVVADMITVFVQDLGKYFPKLVK
jgi:hypothetical protein